jgi:hypothetical protein
VAAKEGILGCPVQRGAERARELDKKEIKPDSMEQDLPQEIEDTYHRIEQKVSLDDTKGTDRKNDADDPVGKTINITV